MFDWSQNPWSGAAAQYPISSNSCMAPQANIPSFMGVAGTTSPMTGHAHAQFQTLPAYAGHAPAQQAAAIEMAPPYQGLDGFNDTDRRSSSIAALRLKAREHMAMGILSAYGK